MSHNQSQQLRMFRLILWQMPPRAKVRVPKQKFQNVGFDFVGFQQLFAAETTSMQRGRSNQKRLDRAPGIECYSIIFKRIDSIDQQFGKDIGCSRSLCKHGKKCEQ